MKLRCLHCEYEFEGAISYDELGWHSSCPECGCSFDVGAYSDTVVERENTMNADFYTNTHSFRRMEYSEIKELEIGDEIAICIMDNPNKVEFIKATVVRPMFWNSDADEPDWEIETDNCFTDIYSIYEVKELFV